MRQANLGIHQSVKFLQTQVTIDIRSIQGDWSLLGVRYDKSRATCSTTSNDKQSAVVDENSVYKLGSVTLPIVCMRTGVQGQSGQVDYPGLDISVATTAGTLPISVPAVAQFPVVWSSEVSDRIKSVELKLQALKKREPKLVCVTNETTTKSTITMGNDADLVYDIDPKLAAEGYSIVSGSCHISGWQNGDNTAYLSGGHYTPTRARCWFKNSRAGLQLTTQATLCKATF